jgi:hypothetical protein
VPRTKYVELVFVNNALQIGTELPSHPLNGYEILSDFRSDGKRKIFLKRSEAAVQPKPRKVKTKAPKTAATAFPGETGGAA